MKIDDDAKWQCEMSFARVPERKNNNPNLRVLGLWLCHVRLGHSIWNPFSSGTQITQWSLWSRRHSVRLPVPRQSRGEACPIALATRMAHHSSCHCQGDGHAPGRGSACKYPGFTGETVSPLFVRNDFNWTRTWKGQPREVFFSKEWKAWKYWVSPSKHCLEDMIIIYKYLTDLHTKVRHELFKVLCGGVRKSWQVVVIKLNWEKITVQLGI